ncbi:unnamed protein product [Gordionus sp. m RMFG-2023]
MKSVVWKHFDISPMDETKAICRICTTIISRGSKFSTSALLNHLRTKHNLELKTWESSDSDCLDGTNFANGYRYPVLIQSDDGSGSNKPSRRPGPCEAVFSGKTELGGALKARDPRLGLIARGGNTKSPVWRTFRVVTFEGKRTNHIACHTCLQVYRYDSHHMGTSNLYRHKCILLNCENSQEEGEYANGITVDEDQDLMDASYHDHPFNESNLNSQDSFFDDKQDAPHQLVASPSQISPLSELDYALGSSRLSGKSNLNGHDKYFKSHPKFNSTQISENIAFADPTQSNQESVKVEYMSNEEMDSADLISSSVTEFFRDFSSDNERALDFWKKISDLGLMKHFVRVIKDRLDHMEGIISKSSAADQSQTKLEDSSADNRKDPLTMLNEPVICAKKLSVLVNSLGLNATLKRMFYYHRRNVVIEQDKNKRELINLKRKLEAEQTKGERLKKKNACFIELIQHQDQLQTLTDDLEEAENGRKDVPLSRDIGKKTPNSKPPSSSDINQSESYGSKSSIKIEMINKDLKESESEVLSENQDLIDISRAFFPDSSSPLTCLTSSYQPLPTHSARSHTPVTETEQQPTTIESDDNKIGNDNNLEIVEFMSPNTVEEYAHFVNSNRDLDDENNLRPEVDRTNLKVAE